MPASAWRVEAVGGCDAGLVGLAEWPEKIVVCKKTVAQLLLGFSICLSSCVIVKMLTRMLGKDICFTFEHLKLASFYYAIPP